MSITNNKGGDATASIDTTWRGLYRTAGIAALAAGVFFRRNIGAEVSLFSLQKQPGSVNDWFMLLQNNRLLGMLYLNVIDIIDYALVGLMFLALYVALRKVSHSAMIVAVCCDLVGTTVYFASNTCFSMLSLSDQYAAATTDAQRSLLLAAGQAMLAINDLGVSNGTGIYVSLTLVAVAGLITSIVMLQSKTFSKTCAYVGILASSFDLVYCLAFPFIPSGAANILSLCTIPAAGLLLMIWHIMLGIRLLKSGEIK